MRLTGKQLVGAAFPVMLRPQVPMPKPSPGLLLLRALAILLAVSALTGWVIFRSASAPKEKSRTRATSSKAQTVSAVYAAAMAARADVETSALPDPVLNEIIEAYRKKEPAASAGESEAGPPDKSTFIPGTKFEVLISPSELLGLWPTARTPTVKLEETWRALPGLEDQWKPVPLLSEDTPDDLQTTDNRP
jgi:hypothetical protein